MTTPKRHQVDYKMLSPSQVGRIFSLDYRISISDLAPEEVGSIGEPEEHWVKLKEGLLTHGIRRPVIVTVRDAVLYLFDGNHRVALAYSLQLEVPALVIQCDCAGLIIDCPDVINLSASCHEITRLDGWEWEQK